MLRRSPDTGTRILVSATVGGGLQGTVVCYLSCLPVASRVQGLNGTARTRCLARDGGGETHWHSDPACESESGHCHRATKQGLW